MNQWINVENELPIEGQEVIYYFSVCGVYRGKFQFYNISKAMRDCMLENNEEIEEYDPKDDIMEDCFYCDMGFLCGDVTHWMPDDKNIDLNNIKLPVL